MDYSFLASILIPRFRLPENIQTKVYSGGIKGINIHFKVIFVVALASSRNQKRGEFFVNAIFTYFGLLYLEWTSDCRIKSQVIEFVPMCFKAEHMVTYTISDS